MRRAARSRGRPPSWKHLSGTRREERAGPPLAASPWMPRSVPGSSRSRRATPGCPSLILLFIRGAWMHAIRFFAAALEVMGARVEDRARASRVTPMELPPRTAASHVKCGLAGVVVSCAPAWRKSLSPDPLRRGRGFLRLPARPAPGRPRTRGRDRHHGTFPFTIQGPIHTPLGAQAQRWTPRFFAVPGRPRSSLPSWATPSSCRLGHRPSMPHVE